MITEEEIAKQQLPAVTTAADLLLLAQKLPTGCPNLDRFLAGGIPCRSITELVGENGAGKTQLCLQLLLHSQLPPSPSASAFYISSEPPLPLRRLQQLADSFLLRLPPSSRPSTPLDNIFLHSVQTADDLLSLLLRLDPILPRLRLLVIDSIAALFRSEFETSSTDLVRRSNLFFRIAGKLKAQASRFGFAVVVANQVGDVIGEETGGGGGCRPLVTSGRRVCPALGLSWANCVNTRLFLSRSQECDFRSSDLNQTRTRRRMQVVFAPHLPSDGSSCEITIDGHGVHGLLDSGL
ncbi:DNA repair XRCC3-like protein [Nymphaea thermarum]|nr:DNA repair XRCC3-like protein [Nymphaea thermarum]